MKDNPIITLCGSKTYDDTLQYIATKLKNDGYDVLMPNLNLNLNEINEMTMKGVIESNYNRIAKSDIIIFMIPFDGYEVRNPIGFMTNMELGYAHSFPDKYLIGIYDQHAYNTLDCKQISTLKAVFDNIIQYNSKLGLRVLYRDQIQKTIPGIIEKLSFYKSINKLIQ